MAPTCDRLTLLLCCGIAAVTVIAFRELLPPVIIGASLAVVLIPAHRRLSARVGITHSATLLTVGVMAGVIAIVAIAAAVLAASTGFLLDMIDTVTGWLPVPPVTGGGLVEVVDGLLPGIPLFLVQVFVLFLSLYLFLFRGERLETDLRGILPEPFEPARGRIERAMADTLHSLYIVNVATALVAFVLVISLFFLLGYGHVLLFSLLTAIFMLVPVVGAAVVMLLVAL
ncbi:MAG: AI-2E family transporter [Methanomicrobiales archaeon]